MLAIVTSTSALTDAKGNPNPRVINALIQVHNGQSEIIVVSNREKPDWFDAEFGNSNISFFKSKSRQDGKIIQTIANAFEIEPYDILVLAACEEDVPMAKNGRAVLMAAGWSRSQKVQDLGIRIDTPEEIQDVISLTLGWDGHWWFEGQGENYRVKALSNLSSMGNVSQQQEDFAKKVTSTVKNGGVRLNALLIVTARSLLIDNIGKQKFLFWGIYPSSNSQNDDSDVLSDFTHRLRTTVSNVHRARRDEPLFIRHTKSIKRSKAGAGVDRLDPEDQVLTLHLNPKYKGKIKGCNVVLIDDCTTYGLSFGVAAAFLMAAEACSMTGVALGKLGDRLHEFEIKISEDPFSPVSSEGFELIPSTKMQGASNGRAQRALVQIIQ